MSRNRARAGLVGAGIANLAVVASVAASLVGPTDEAGRPPLALWLVGMAGMVLASWSFGLPRRRRSGWGWGSVKSFVVPLATAAEWPPRVILWTARVLVVAVVAVMAASFLQIGHGR